jgi:hypothetical protein
MGYCNYFNRYTFPLPELLYRFELNPADLYFIFAGGIPK